MMIRSSNGLSRLTFFLLVIVACGQIGRGDSAIPLLSGFDRERIDAAYPPTDSRSLGELAKLAYRLRSLSPNALEQRIDHDRELTVGDAIEVEGRAESITTLAVPDELVEFLEFSRMHVLDVQDGRGTTRIIATEPPAGLQVGDRVAATGVLIELSDNTGDSETADSDESEDTPWRVMVSSKVRWFPESPGNVGQQLLIDSGFDLGLLAGVAARNRQPLLAEDGDAFYSMLAAATSVAQRDSLPSPVSADPVALLRNPDAMSGQWVQMELESVQITRIRVTEPYRQEQLGRDHYYQIDAVGDLGGVVIKIESPDDQVPPATFQNRYPVSLVTTELPDFLRQQLRRDQRDDAIVAPLRWKLAADGFFYRLWGYESEFMAQHGGGQQFGPLVVAARFHNREPVSSDPAGVAAIGTAAAVAVVTALLLIWWWQRRVWASDETARRRRQASEAEQLQLPQ